MSANTDSKEKLYNFGIKEESEEDSEISGAGSNVAEATSLSNSGSKNVSIPSDHTPELLAPQIPRRPRKKDPSTIGKDWSSEKANIAAQGSFFIPESKSLHPGLSIVETVEIAHEDTAPKQEISSLREQFSKTNTFIKDECKSAEGVNRPISKELIDPELKNVSTRPIDSSSEKKDEKAGNIPVIPSKRPVKSTKTKPASQEKKDLAICSVNMAPFSESSIEEALCDPCVDLLHTCKVSSSLPGNEETHLAIEKEQLEQEVNEHHSTSDPAKEMFDEFVDSSIRVENPIVENCSTELDPDSKKKNTASKKTSLKIAAFQQMFEKKPPASDMHLQSEKRLENPTKYITSEHEQLKSSEKMHAKDANLNAQFIKNLNGMIGMALPGMAVPGIVKQPDNETGTKSDAQHDHKVNPVSKDQPRKSTHRDRIKGPRGKRLPKIISEPFEKPDSSFVLFLEDIWQLKTISQTTSEVSVGAESKSNESLKMMEKQVTSSPSDEYQDSNSEEVTAQPFENQSHSQFTGGLGLEEAAVEIDYSENSAKEYQDEPQQKSNTENSIPTNELDSEEHNLVQPFTTP